MLGRCNKEDGECSMTNIVTWVECFTDFRIHHNIANNSSLVAKFVNKLKNRKYPGLDNLLNERLKHGSKELIEDLATLFQKIMTKVVPGYMNGKHRNPHSRESGQKTTRKL